MYAETAATIPTITQNQGFEQGHNVLIYVIRWNYIIGHEAVMILNLISYESVITARSHTFQEIHERSAAKHRPLIDAGMFQNLCKHKAGLFLNDLQCIFLRENIVLAERLCPSNVLFGQLAAPQVGTGYQRISHSSQLLL